MWNEIDLKYLSEIKNIIRLSFCFMQVKYLLICLFHTVNYLKKFILNHSVKNNALWKKSTYTEIKYPWYWRRCLWFQTIESMSIKRVAYQIYKSIIG